MLWLPAVAQLAGRAVAITGPGLGKKSILALAGAQGIDIIGNAFGWFDDPDISDVQRRVEQAAEAAEELRGALLVPTRRPKWAESPEWADKPGRYFVYDEGTERAWYQWNHITRNMVNAAVERALTPRTQVRSRPAYRRRR